MASWQNKFKTNLGGPAPAEVVPDLFGTRKMASLPVGHARFGEYFIFASFARRQTIQFSY